MSFPRIQEENVQITPEFIAHISSGLVRPFFRAESVPIAEMRNEVRKYPIKRAREDVASRSRSEIINWVLNNNELAKACICPYCLKIHSRRDNARVHMKNYHKEFPVREFIRNVDATLEEVREANESGRFPINRIGEKRPRTSSASNTFSNLSINGNEERNDEPGPKQFNGNTLEQFLADIDIKFKNQQQEEREVNEEAIASVATLDVSNSPKSSREPSPNSSHQGDLNGSTESVHSPIQLIHNPLTPFGCVFCPCSFPRINDLTTHIAHVHRTKYRCNTCLAEFVQPQHLEQHYTTCHVSDSTPNSQ